VNISDARGLATGDVACRQISNARRVDGRAKWRWCDKPEPREAFGKEMHKRRQLLEEYVFNRFKTTLYTTTFCRKEEAQRRGCFGRERAQSAFKQSQGMKCESVLKYQILLLSCEV
jgi:hypothetical protein